MMKGTKIFSKTALDRLASPEQMDQLLSFGPPRLWLTLFGLLAILLAAICWGFLGRVATDVSGQGVLIESGGVEGVSSLGSGQIDKVLVAPGQHVDADTVVATLHQQQPMDELRAAESALSDLKRELSESQGIHDKQIALETASYARQRVALEQQAANLERESETFRKRRETERALLAKGLITNRQMTGTDQELANAEAAEAQNTSQMSTLESEHYRAMHASAEEHLQLESRVDAARRRVEELQHGFQGASEVRSTASGDVTEVSVRPGSVVSSGTPVVRLQTGAGRLYAAVYTSGNTAKQIQPGMEVQISPAGLKREEYGFLRGVVARVSPFPVSSEELLERFANDSLAHALEMHGPVSEVDVALEPNPASPGSYTWSSPKGANVPLSAGTLLSADIVVREERPVSLVIPYARKKLGWR